MSTKKDGIRVPPKIGSNYLKDWEDYGVIVNQERLRKLVFKRDGGVCAKCGEVAKEWQADHIYPLWLVDKNDYPNCLKYWSINNAQTVCMSCANKKTTRETKDRAKINRIRRKYASSPYRQVHRS